MNILGVLLPLAALAAPASPRVTPPSPAQATSPWQYDDLRSGDWLDHWLVAGPFPAFSGAVPAEEAEAEAGLKAALDRDWLASAGGEARRAPPVTLTITTGGTPVAWTPVYSESGSLDFNAFYGRTSNAVAYAMAEIRSKERQRWWVQLFSDDGVKVFMNGVPVLDHFILRKFDSPADWFPVQLEPGVNRFMVKVVNGAQDWKVCTRWLSDGDALAVTASWADPEPLELLLAKGCPVDARVDGMTALHTAVLYSRSTTAASLLFAGAAAAPRSPAGVTPRHIAERQGADAITAMLRETKTPHSPAPARARQSDEMLTYHLAEGGPGAAVAVLEGGKVLYKACAGLARIDTNERVTTRTRFHIGSVSKQFVAMGVLLLAQRGRLRLEQPVRDFIPELPARFDHVTIRQLVRHTSGLPRELVATDPPPDAYRTWPQLLAAIRTATNFSEPGARYEYSSFGYVLLCIAMERAAGLPVAEYLATAVFTPLGMRDTRVDDASRDDPRLATSYYRTGRNWIAQENRGFIQREHQIRNIAGMTSTLEDLIRWDRAWRDPVLLSAEALADALKPGLLKDGTVASQGFGWHLGEGRRARQLWHQGQVLNFRALVWRHLDRPVTIICLMNVPGNEWNITDHLAQIWLGRNTWLQE